MLEELPPTAGLPLEWRDLWHAPLEPFEVRAARLLGLPDIQLECSGTASLVIALATLREWSTRQTVIVPGYTCPLVALAILRCGLRIKVCDLAPDDFNMDPAQLAALCDSNTLAVLPTHLAGRAPNIYEAARLAREADAWVIEDAAQAFAPGAGRFCVQGVSDIVIFSLAVGKGLTLYEGGLLGAHRALLRQALRDMSARLAPVNRRQESKRVAQLLGYAACYRPSLLRLVYGMPLRRALSRGDIAAAAGDDIPTHIPIHRVGAWRRRVASSALNRIARFQWEGACRAHQRLQRLQSIQGCKVFADGDEDAAWPAFLVLMPTADTCLHVLRKLWPAGLGVSRPFAHALADYPALRPHVPQGFTPRARDFAARALTITNSPWLSDAQFERIAATLAQAASA